MEESKMDFGILHEDKEVPIVSTRKMYNGGMFSFPPHILDALKLKKDDEVKLCLKRGKFGMYVAVWTERAEKQTNHQTTLYEVEEDNWKND